MSTRAAVCSAFLLLSFSALGQMSTPAPVNSPLLDHLVGKWVMTGNTMGKPTTHDIEASWVLQHHYLRIREVSREKDAKGQPQYEATVYLTWNQQAKQYHCTWIDVFGGSLEQELGFAENRENQIPFIFRNSKGNADFENDFNYDPKTDTWQWVLDNIADGTHRPFARYKLTRS